MEKLTKQKTAVTWIRIDRMRIRIHKIYFEPFFKSQEEKNIFKSMPNP